MTGDVHTRPTADDPDYLALAMRNVHQRGRRTNLFSPTLFANPGWDIMLRLFIAHEAHASQTAISQTFQIDPADPLTGRWIRVLAHEDLVTIPTVGEHPQLTSAAVSLMRDYFAPAR